MAENDLKRAIDEFMARSGGEVSTATPTAEIREENDALKSQVVALRLHIDEMTANANRLHESRDRAMAELQARLEKYEAHVQNLLKVCAARQYARRW